MRKALLIALKDIVSELRGRQSLALMALFAALTALIFGFSFSVSRPALAEVFPGLLWVAFYFAGLVGLGRSIAAERRNATFEGLLLAPGPAAGLFAGKFLANLVFLTLTEALTLAILHLFFGFRYAGPAFPLGAVIFLGTVGFAAAGTFLSVIAGATRMGEALLPALLLPLAAPAVIASVGATANLYSGAAPGAWIKLLLVYDAVFCVLPFLLFDEVLEGWGE